MVKFGGGLTGYVHGGAVKPSHADDGGDTTTSNSASAALRTAAAASLIESSVGPGSAEAPATTDGIHHAPPSAHASSTGRSADLHQANQAALLPVASAAGGAAVADRSVQSTPECSVASSDGPPEAMRLSPAVPIPPRRIESADASPSAVAGAATPPRSSHSPVRPAPPLVSPTSADATPGHQPTAGVQGAAVHSSPAANSDGGGGPARSTALAAASSALLDEVMERRLPAAPTSPLISPPLSSSSRSLGSPELQPTVGSRVGAGVEPPQPLCITATFQTGGAGTGAGTPLPTKPSAPEEAATGLKVGSARRGAQSSR